MMEAQVMGMDVTSNCAIESGWTCTPGDSLNPSECSDI